MDFSTFSCVPISSSCCMSNFPRPFPCASLMIWISKLHFFSFQLEHTEILGGGRCPSPVDNLGPPACHSGDSGRIKIEEAKKGCIVSSSSSSNSISDNDIEAILLPHFLPLVLLIPWHGAPLISAIAGAMNVILTPCRKWKKQSDSVLMFVSTSLNAHSKMPRGRSRAPQHSYSTVIPLCTSFSCSASEIFNSYGKYAGGVRRGRERECKLRRTHPGNGWRHLWKERG